MIYLSDLTLHLTNAPRSSGRLGELKLAALQVSKILGGAAVVPLVALGGGAVLGLVFHVGSPMQMLRMNAAEAAIVAAMGGLMFRDQLAHGR